jgi:hypothetical protein
LRGDPGFGLQRALRMSWMPARIMQLEEVRGMQTSVGNHETLSQSRMVQVSQIQMVKLRHESKAGPTRHQTKKSVCRGFHGR